MKNLVKTVAISSGNVRTNEQGSAVVIALFVLVLVSLFVVLATSRTAAESFAVGNEASEGRTFYAAQGSLEIMTHNFNKVFERRLSPTQADLDIVVNPARVNSVAGFENFTFQQELDPIPLSAEERTVVLPGGPFAGLYAIRGNWRLRTTVTDPQGTQVQLTRNILNNQIPIFQFGIFYDDDLELYRPPLFSFGGRVHSNRHFFVSPGPDGVYFDSRVTAAGHVITQTWRNGYTGDNYNNTYIKDAAGINRQLHRNNGSVLNGTPNIFSSEPDLPESMENPGWATSSAVFDGNLQAQAPELKLPLKVGDNAAQAELIDMIKRGKEIDNGAGGDLASNGTSAVPVTAATVDNDILRAERFANKPGIRISLADSKAKLPGCATSMGTAVTGRCGIRLDGHMVPGDAGIEPSPSPAPTPQRSRGYDPLPMTDGYKATRLNGSRFYHGNQLWIKVETVSVNPTDNSIVTVDITEDFLSLGVTEVPAMAWGGSATCSGVPSNSICIMGYTGTMANNGSPTAPSSNLTATTPQSPSTYPDSRSIIKLQRLVMEGPQVRTDSTLVRHSPTLRVNASDPGSSVVVRFTGVDTATKVANACASGCTGASSDPNSSLEHMGHLLRAVIPATVSPTTAANPAIVPFPIKLFDMREGNYYDRALTNPATAPALTSLYPTANFGTIGNISSDPALAQRMSTNGVMSLVDIDVANLRRFLRGDFNGRFPNGLTNTAIPENGGWVIYVSDRRGDYDFDGEFDMEDVYGQAEGITPALNLGEDVNRSNALENKVCAFSTSLNCEAELYRTRTVFGDAAAVNDHKYFRRGVRLVNATVVPGIYDSTNPSNTRGVTFASENGIYVKGNFNATHVASVPPTGNTPYNDYRPLNTATHIPASIVADGVTILSNAWNDGKSFRFPYELASRRAEDTTIRFAMIAGDTIATKEATPHQGGISPRLNGGVHNFKRFLERWTDPNDATFRKLLNYSGSLINLYNSRNANGSFKCCNMVYNPPVRNWVFDSTFLDPSRLPPGTPYFQYVQTTGFLRTND